MAWAINPFPVPVSPLIKIVLSLSATRSTKRKIFCIRALSPTIPLNGSICLDGKADSSNTAHVSPSLIIAEFCTHIPPTLV